MLYYQLHPLEKSEISEEEEVEEAPDENVIFEKREPVII